MKISSKQYALALFDVVSDKKGKELEKAIAAFVKLLISRHEEYKIAKIALDFEELWYSKALVVKTEIKSARALSKDIVAKLSVAVKKISGAKEIDLLEKIDEAIIGGAVIKYGDKIVDISLRNRLQKIKEALSV